MNFPPFDPNFVPFNPDFVPFNMGGFNPINMKIPFETDLIQSIESDDICPDSLVTASKDFFPSGGVTDIDRKLREVSLEVVETHDKWQKARNAKDNRKNQEEHYRKMFVISQEKWQHLLNACNTNERLREVSPDMVVISGKEYHRNISENDAKEEERKARNLADENDAKQDNFFSGSLTDIKLSMSDLDNILSINQNANEDASHSGNLESILEDAQEFDNILTLETGGVDYSVGLPVTELDWDILREQMRGNSFQS
ncbi:hypothetical protein PENSTE_c004G00851 [Penicillium steckii]|uniref:Uncharacterized protein n=1 Tax=Penicillium steckii TaxID=303698 RepID=A0A1V6TMJ1_9EURO|nr:hypothetical protein PENSTE_c004G00851 [Penicillium steckii]